MAIARIGVAEPLSLALQVQTGVAYTTSTSQLEAETRLFIQSQQQMEESTLTV